MKQPQRPVALMTVAQVICTLAVPITVLFALQPFLYAMFYAIFADYVHHDNTLIVAIMQFLMSIPDVILGGCLVFVEVEAFRLCGRMKKASAFSPLNVAGLGRITIALFISGVITLFFGDAIVPFLLTGLPEIAPVIQYLLLPFTLLTLSLMARAVQVLMRRAVDMQEETDLTI